MILTNLTKKEKHGKQFPKREKWSKNINTLSKKKAKKGSSNFIDLQMLTIIRRSTLFLLQYFSIIFQASNMFFPVCDTCCGKVVGQDGI